MNVNTTRFGPITIDSEQIVLFPEGVPGFEHTRQYAFIPHPSNDAPSPFQWMQSVEDPALAFPVIDPWQIHDGYAPTIPGQVLRELEITDIRRQAKVWAIVTIPKQHPERATVNLLAPILINRETRTAKQVVLLGDTYTLRTALAGDSHGAAEARQHGRGESFAMA